VFGMETPKRMSICNGINCLIRLTAFLKEKPSERRSVTEVKMDGVRAASIRNPHESTRHTAR
jgi:hypothetical protein